MSFGASGLCLSFGGRQALRDVDLAIPTGQVTAIVGGDGAGKSSLLHCLAGTVAPDAGSIVRPDKRHLGSMPAQSGTWGDLTVDENLSFAASAHGIASATFAERRDDLLERATLTGARDRLARDLSGGMRRKLGFIVAVLHRPELLLLDEPSTGVDPVSRVELWRLIAEAAASVPLLLYSGADELEDHALLDLLARPSPGQTYTDLMEAWLGFLLVSGNGYLEAVAYGGRLRELHALRPDRMRVVPGADGAEDRVVFDLTLGDRETLGFTAYRAERLDLYAPSA